MEPFKVIIVEDVPLELKGTEGIFKNEIPEAEIIGTAESEISYWRLIKQQVPDLVLLDLGLGGSTTIGVEICRQTKETYPAVKVLIFTGEILNEKLWVDVLDAGCDGIILKSGELLIESSIRQTKTHTFGSQLLIKLTQFLMENQLCHVLIHIIEHHHIRQTVDKLRLKGFLHLCKHRITTGNITVETYICL